MKKFIIASVVLTFIAGTVVAQDNKVKLVKQNAELIKRANNDKVNDAEHIHPVLVTEKHPIRKEGSCKNATSEKGKVLPSKSLKLENIKKRSVKSQKMKPTRNQNN